MDILHISDLHIGNGKGEAARCNNIVNWLRDQQEADRWAGDLPYIVITGDVVDDGRERQYDIAAGLFDRLRAEGYEVLACPGNHDYGFEGNIAKAEKIDVFGDFLQQSIDFPLVTRVPDTQIYLIGLDSMEAETGTFDRFGADGELGEEQIERLQRKINGIRADPDARPDARIVVYLHHHPFLFPDGSWLNHVAYERLFHYLKDGERFLKAVADVDVLLFGHEHRHVDFSGYKPFSTQPRSPLVLSCGKSSKVSQAYKANSEGLPEDPSDPGQLGYLINVPPDSTKPSAEVVDFLS